MQNAELQELITSLVPDSQVTIDGDGYHFNAVIISSSFNGLSKVKRQQLVYSGMSPYITSGAVHALNLNTYTPQEWKQKHG